MDFSKGPQIAAAIPHKSNVTSLSYHGSGSHVFAATESDSKLYVINAQTGKMEVPAFRCEREGISRISSTHHDQCILFVGRKGSQSNNASNAVHYWSLYDNKILRKFRGHSDVVTDISMSPADDLFLTSSKDRTARLWNIQQAGCVAKMDLPSNTDGQPRCVFDSTGMVFAVMAKMTGGQGNYIHLYDARNFSGGAFSELHITSSDLQQAMRTQRVPVPTDPIDWKSIEFNMSGNRILVQADPGLAIVLDGYEGTVQRIFKPSKGKANVSCFTPDDQTVLIGTDSGGIDCWNVQSGTVVGHLEGHLGPVNGLVCNPRCAQVASSCTNTCLWLW